MAALLTQPKNEYLLQVSIENLHQETLEWISEIEFSRTELVFLRGLLSKAFLYVQKNEKLAELNELEKKVAVFYEKFLATMHDILLLHESHLGILVKNSMPQDEQSIREEHKKYGNAIRTFMDSVKEIKTEIFSIVEIHLRQNKKITKDFEEGGMAL